MMLSSPTAFIPSFSLDDAPKSTIMECKTLAVQPSRTNIGLLAASYRTFNINGNKKPVEVAG